MQEEWIRLAAQGNEDAYRRLFELWFPKAYRIGKSICGSRSFAEDAVQEALIRFWNALNGRKGRALTEAYFMRIVANESRRIRGRRRAAPEEFLENLPGDAATPEEAETEKERLAALTGAVDRLPDTLRDAVKLRYFGGFTEAETAELLGVSLSCAKMRLLRGRQKLKSILEDREFDATGGC
jgi:RNA polymerase sigma factor (sigma-70 family)